MTIPGEIIREKRISLGIGMAEFAARIGLSEQECYDIESYYDEFEQSVTVHVIKNIGKILDIDMGDVLGVYFLSVRSETTISFSEFERRTFNEIDFDDLSDFVGLIESECKIATVNINKICDWPLFSLLGFCKYFSLDPRDLLCRLQCSK